jgi:glycerol-3-phosphate dehydrogenase
LLGVKARSTTRRLQLVGADGYREPADAASAHLADRYGTSAGDIAALVDAEPELGEPLVPGLPYLRAEAVYAARHEMAVTLDDVLSRRTRARLFDRAATVAAAPEVARLLAAELGWDAAETERQVAHFVRACAAEEDAATKEEAALLGAEQ